MTARTRKQREFDAARAGFRRARAGCVVSFLTSALLLLLVGSFSWAIPVALVSLVATVPLLIVNAAMRCPNCGKLFYGFRRGSVILAFKCRHCGFAP